jgi:hypothetical protein
VSITILADRKKILTPFKSDTHIQVIFQAGDAESHDKDSANYIVHIAVRNRIRQRSNAFMVFYRERAGTKDKASISTA